MARCGVGVDNIDVAAATERGIPVVYAPGSTTTAVAEHAMMLMLAASRRLCTLNAAVHAGNWAIRNGWTSVELAGKTLGIVGLGDIGQRVATLATAFGMQVAYWSRSSRDEGLQYLPLDELLAQSDVVSLHVGLNAETRHLIGADTLARLKPGAILVNTARGGVIDQAALAAALDSGQVGFFATDVLETQPPAAADPLLGHERVLVTPHVAALTDATFRHICVRSASNVLAILRGEEPEREAVYNRERVGIYGRGEQDVQD